MENSGSSGQIESVKRSKELFGQGKLTYLFNQNRVVEIYQSQSEGIGLNRVVKRTVLTANVA